jgi:hypothetical protein
MRTRTAARIVTNYLDHKDKYGFWPTHLNHHDRRNIIHAIKLINYKPGDFSFIKNDFKRQALEHDYQVISRLKAWKVLRYHDHLDEFIDDTNGGIWDFIYFYMYFYHNKDTAKLSLENLEYISKNGWERYVLKNLN